MVVLDAKEHGCGGTGDDFTWEVPYDRLQDDWMLVFAILVHFVDLGEELLVGTVAKALEYPVDSWLEE